MFKLKYQLSPNGPYVGGGKEVGESSGESSDISTSGGVTRGLIDYTTEDGETVSVSVIYDADGNIIPNTIDNNQQLLCNWTDQDFRVNKYGDRVLKKQNNNDNLVYHSRVLL